MTVRPWHLRRALESVRSLREILTELTEEEVHHALQLECDTNRRQSIVDILISKAAEFNLKTLKEKYQCNSR